MKQTKMKQFARIVCRDQGFSLIELMVGLAIVAIAATVAMPNLISWRANARLKSAARNLYADMQLAKMTAVKRNCNVVVALNPVACPGLPNTMPTPGGGYQVFVDDGAGGGNAGNSIRDGAEVVLKNITMPSNAAFCNGNETFAGVTTGFTQRGLLIANNNGTATLVNDQAQFYILTLSAAGGIQLQ